MSGKVFINYRRVESLKDARHLAALLDRGSLKGRVFIDLKGLDGAGDWLTELERQVAASDVVVSLICRDWTEVKGDDGKRRIDNEGDFVRYELAEAFRRKIPVVPVLIDGARMPAGNQLPPQLLLLTRPQAEVLRTETFDADVDKIAARIRAEIAERRRQRRKALPVWAAATMSAAALLLGVALGLFVFNSELASAKAELEKKSGLVSKLAETYGPQCSNGQVRRVSDDAKIVCVATKPITIRF